MMIAIRELHGQQLPVISTTAAIEEKLNHGEYLLLAHHQHQKGT